MKPTLLFLRRPWTQLAAILLVYAALLLPTVRRQGISWDEQNDLWVAQSYLQADGWLKGSDIDPSQTRLPMFSVALVYSLLHTSDLVTGRIVSVVIGALTIVAVYIYCREHLDPLRGLLAAGLLATSPFFLAFGRVAFTETDIYLACTLAWLLVCLARYQGHPTLGNAVLVGVMLGLGISAKFTMLSVFPVAWYALAQAKSPGKRLDPSPQTNVLWLWTNFMLIAMLVGLGYVALTPPPEYTGKTRLVHYGLVLLAWALPLVWAGWKRSERTPKGVTAAFITALALLTFLVVPPEHLTNPAILRSLEWRFSHEMPHPAAFAFEAGALHILTILLKSSPVIGLGLLLSLIFTTLQWKSSTVQVPLLVAWLYLAGLLTLPLAQTFYTIPLLPALAILAADLFLRLWSLRRKVALGIAFLAGLSLAVDLALCYPDFNLNGYQYLGRRVIAGRSSIGYRSIVQTPSDGVQQAIAWLNENAKPGERVLAYVLPWHIVQATAPHPAYRIVQGFKGSLYTNPDYVVVHINAQVRQSWWTDVYTGEVFTPPYDAAWLEAHYRKVFAVQRRFGIEMASVWHKKD